MSEPADRLSLRDLVKYAFTPSSFDILYELDPGIPIEEVPRWQLIAPKVLLVVWAPIGVASMIAAIMDLAALLSSS